MKTAVALLCAVALSGCASTDYAAYIKAHETQSIALAARYQALAEIARSGDTTAKVAAVMSLQGAGQGQQQSFIAPPKTLGEQALQWASLIVPTAAQVYAVKSQTSVALRQSDNSALIAKSTNDAFVGIAGKIQAPAANVTTTNTTNTTTVGRDGVIGDGVLTRNCAAGAGGPGAAGAAGGQATSAPSVSASGATGSPSSIGGAGGAGAAGGAGGALSC